MSYEVRKLPKKTVIIIWTMVIIIAILFFIEEGLKKERFTEILASLGHTSIKELKIISKMSVEDIDTKLNSDVFKVKFFDNNLNQTCVGFLHKEKDEKYSQDFDCK